MSNDNRTYGEMSTLELLRSAREELTGLVDLAERLSKGNPDFMLYIGAYHGSIAARIAVAEIKIERGEHRLPVEGR